MRDESAPVRDLTDLSGSGEDPDSELIGKQAGAVVYCLLCLCR